MKEPIAHTNTRFLGFDFLRGLCALMVCIYHLCLWQEIADLRLVGNYSVYIFFILSGASMTIAYADKFAQGIDMRTFLGRRFFRLAPLYWLITIVFGYASSTWAPLVLNLAFLFGFANPAFTSRVVGGWSLGIEFVFYLLFPVYLQCIIGKRWPYILLTAAIVIQQLFINSWIQNDNDQVTHVYEFTQFAAFFAYFLGGCVIGKMLMENRSLPARPALIWLLFLTLFIGIELIAAYCKDPYMANISGLVFTVACILCTGISGALQFKPSLAYIPRLSGNISYGLYLLHPVLYFNLIKYTDLQQTMGTTIFTVFIIVMAIALAIILEKYFESPIKTLGYNWLQKIKKPETDLNSLP